MAIRVILADDHLMVREGLRNVLQRTRFEVVGEADNGQEAIRLAEQLHPDVAVLDLSMPVLNGLESARRMRKVSPDTKTVLLTMYAEEQYVVEALRAGITGYVLKTQAGEDLVRAVQEVAQGKMYLSPGISRVVVEAYLSEKRYPGDPLSFREREILQLVAEGKTTKEIAALLGISVKTAEAHRGRIMKKLDIHDTAGLVRDAIRKGLITP